MNSNNQEPEDDPRLASPENRYEGSFVRLLGRISKAWIFIVGFAVVGIILIRLGACN